MWKQCNVSDGSMIKIGKMFFLFSFSWKKAFAGKMLVPNDSKSGNVATPIVADQEVGSPHLFLNLCLITELKRGGRVLVYTFWYWYMKIPISFLKIFRNVRNFFSLFYLTNAWIMKKFVFEIVIKIGVKKVSLWKI